MVNNVNPIEGVVYYSRSLFDLLPEKAAFGALLAWVSGVLGADPMLVALTLISLVADFALGMWEAVRRGHFRCRIMARGVAKFPCYCVYIILVWWVDVALSHAIGFQVPLVKFFLAYLILTDTVSIIAHLERMGWRVPKLLALIVRRGRKKLVSSVEKSLPDDDKDDPDGGM